MSTRIRRLALAITAGLLCAGCAQGEEAGPATDPPDEEIGAASVDAGDPIADPDGLGEGGGYVPDSVGVGR